MSSEPSPRSAQVRPGAPSKHFAWIGAGILVALLAGWAVHAVTSDHPNAERGTTVSGTPAPNRTNAEILASIAAPEKDVASHAHAPDFVPTVCWRDLDQFDGSVTLATFREWAAPLLNSRDALVREYLKDRLTELIGNDPAHALEVLGWATTADGRAYQVILSAVRDSDAVQKPEVAARLMDLGMDGSLVTERRAGILSALDTQKHLSAPMRARLTAFARDPASGEAGWAAARTLARVMEREQHQHGDITPYLNDLLSIGADAPDEQIRYLGEMMPMHVAPLLNEEETERFAKILTSEGNEDGRDAAAQNLSLSSDKPRVLALFAKTFESDPSVCVRWAVFRFSARTAGKAALPLMLKMAQSDPRFEQPYREFAQLYAAGNLDFVRIWQGLPHQDPFHCLERDH